MNNITFTHNPTNNTIGFVYKAYLPNNEIYIGRKNYTKKITKKPLKGKKNKRHTTIDSNWKEYRSSNEYVKKNAIKFEVIKECYSLSELKATEAYYILRSYLNKDNLINKWIEGKIILPRKPNENKDPKNKKTKK